MFKLTWTSTDWISCESLVF